MPEGQSYLEYADGHIEIQEMEDDDLTFKSTIVRVLGKAEADLVTKKNLLS
ncbi:hypothetical protein [Mucilaginibacter sp. L3T2-6]|uniref:hypothetical protein n=1 Tax=Mucilaginibacter sp. L3T2-6 TaxID=3062491 RepID=UPI0026769484|nr:hypothetical protein [Mucilaginibacter sp. L3T2-6]MDO3641352.1 hypothetical protein [Mucilaginibacter sp. L3T2-6]MDV6213887.1 hypothetical protein [Mucilaginibacter sp. L3T2-6]